MYSKKNLLLGGIALVALLVGTHFMNQAPAMETDHHDVTEELGGHALTASELDAGIPAPKTDTQYVVLSFDGSRDLTMWTESREFAKSMAEQNKPVHFTYFISGVYFLNYADRNTYQGPGQAVGFSPIGFATSDKDISKRVEQVSLALKEGHEIGSHANGHFSGSNWSVQQWEDEFKQFYKFVDDAFIKNGLEDAPEKIIRGFRAPLLAYNEPLYSVLKSHNYSYDVSTHVGHPARPYIQPDGIWEFPLPSIPYNGDAKHPVLAMDYNFYYKQTGAIDKAKRGDDLWNQLYGITLNSYRDYFNSQYNGQRIPVLIVNHFSRYNDSVYWEVMKSFASEVCGKPKVRCVTYSELLSALK